MLRFIPYLLGVQSLMACSSPDSSGEELRQQVRGVMAAAEQQSEVRVVLSPAEREAQNSRWLPFRDRIPEGYPQPFLPLGTLQNPTLDPRLNMTPRLDASWVELGRRLFEDTALSYSPKRGQEGTISCQSCHLASESFADRRPRSPGVDGDLTHRNSPTLLNVAYLSTLTWANPVFPVLEMQARIPLFGDDPVEMGQRGRDREMFAQLLRADPDYLRLFREVFRLEGLTGPNDPRLHYNLIAAALAAYQRSLIDFDTPFDRWLQGRLSEDDTMLDAEALEGVRLFFGVKNLRSGTRLPCSQCHSGLMLSDSYQYVREGVLYSHRGFHNTGLYNIDGRGAYPAPNQGFARAEQLAEHPEWMGRFRTPPLRFVAQTAPYGHDGSLADLEAVIAHYAQGGRASQSPFGQNPYVDARIRDGFRIEADETQALLAFLKALDSSSTRRRE